MDIVEFLEARIDEEEAELHHAEIDDPEAAATLASKLRAECAQKRDILEDWKRAAASEGISDTEDAQGEVTMARRSMLTILAALYKDHPDYDPNWSATLD